MIWVSSTIVVPDKSLIKTRMRMHSHYTFRMKFQEVLNSLYLLLLFSIIRDHLDVLYPLKLFACTWYSHYPVLQVVLASCVIFIDVFF